MINHSINTAAGNFYILIGNGALLYCGWSIENFKRISDKYQYLAGKYNPGCIHTPCSKDHEILDMMKSAIDTYFSKGFLSCELVKTCENLSFKINDSPTIIPLKLSDTPFQHKVWEEISRIKYGETISYLQLAEKVGSPKGYRAVANACGKNPYALFIPCHRVVASNGKLGGFTGGTHIKQYLLHHESITPKQKNIRV